MPYIPLQPVRDARYMAVHGAGRNSSFCIEKDAYSCKTSSLQSWDVNSCMKLSCLVIMNTTESSPV
jgi:hypothetical protein